jgi:hypothetical protein
MAFEGSLPDCTHIVCTWLPRSVIGNDAGGLTRRQAVRGAAVEIYGQGYDKARGLETEVYYLLR